jgi:hypothetical protein
MAGFVVEPAWCSITYSAEANSSWVDDLMVFDPETRTFTFDYSADLIPSSTDEISYIVTVTGTAGLVASKSAEGTFILKVANPCIDSNFVQISDPALAPIQYTIKTFAPLG